MWELQILGTLPTASGIKDFEKIDLSKDQKPGRYFEDQPDITDEHQIHFIYLLPAYAGCGNCRS